MTAIPWWEIRRDVSLLYFIIRTVCWSGSQNECRKRLNKRQNQTMMGNAVPKHKSLPKLYIESETKKFSFVTFRSLSPYTWIKVFFWYFVGDQWYFLFCFAHWSIFIYHFWYKRILNSWHSLYKIRRFSFDFALKYSQQFQKYILFNSIEWTPLLFVIMIQK